MRQEIKEVKQCSECNSILESAKYTIICDTCGRDLTQCDTDAYIEDLLLNREEKHGDKWVHFCNLKEKFEWLKQHKQWFDVCSSERSFE